MAQQVDGTIRKLAAIAMLEAGGERTRISPA